MFSLFNGIYDSYLAPTQLNLLVVGAPESGKTTLLERLKVTDIPSRPRKGMSNRVEQPPATLQSALLKTGAAMGRHSLSKTSLASGTSSTSNEKPVEVKPTKAKAVPAKPKKKNRFMLICPAPERYMRAAQDQDEEYVEDDDEEEVSEPMNDIFREDSFSGAPPLRARSHSKEWNVDSLDLSTSDGVDNLVAATGNTGVPRSGTSERETSMQSIGLDDDDHPAPVPKEPLHTQQEEAEEKHEVGPALLQSSTQEYNVKAKAKMLPLRMIRPTIGTNLAKIDMYGAKCHIFDVGGRLQDLWERYYDDCDAVIFCWKLGEDPDKPPKEPDSDDDSDDEEEPIEERIYKQQQKLLDMVRKSIPDDVPFLVMGHVFGNANTEVVDTMYNTDLLMPRYHNPMTGFCCSSAKTGAGVQSAMEWLIPMAKRQQKERIASKRELETMLEEQGKTI